MSVFACVFVTKKEKHVKNNHLRNRSSFFVDGSCGGYGRLYDVGWPSAVAERQ